MLLKDQNETFQTMDVNGPIRATSLFNVPT